MAARDAEEVTTAAAAAASDIPERTHLPAGRTVSHNPTSPERRGHVRSASQGTQMPGPSILKGPERAETARRGHARAFSHGGVGLDGLDEVTRAGSRTEFTLPPGHGARERSGRGSTARQRHGSRPDSLFRGHSRQASRSESVYTLRQTQQRSSMFDCLCFWRKKTLEEARVRVVVPNHTVPPDTPAKQHPNAAFSNNHVRTTKYTVLSFLPKNLFEQFHRFANLYFLFIVLLNWVPEISAFGREVAMLPLVFVMGVTAIKDLFEDRRRYLSDRRVNTSTCRVYDRDSGHYVQRLWRHVRVGDLVHLSCDELIPADLLLLHCSDSQDVCYIDTCNLDGETNLKQRRVVRGLEGKHETFHASKFFGTVECNTPTTKLYRFHGSVIHQRSQQRVPITSDNLMLREGVLKNIDYVEGIVVYAGHETKALLNNGGPRYKRSKLERQMNMEVIYCVIILLLLCFTGATGSGLWLGGFSDTVPFFPYSYNSLNPPLEGFITFWTFVIILQVMIPVSLYVTLEIIKLMQVYHIHNDIELYDSVTNKRTECRALNITEELGQVQYLFSDKTGTLTENKMVFRQCTIGGIDYSHDAVMEGTGKFEKPSFVLNRRLQDELSQMDIQLSVVKHTGELLFTPHAARVRDFFLLMTCCNTVVVAKHPHKDKLSSSGTTLLEEGADESSHTIPTLATTPEEGPLETSDAPDFVRTPKKWRRKLATGKTDWLTLPLSLPRKTSRASTPTPRELRPIFEAESPDEMALVEAAYKYNVKLLRRTNTHMVVSLPAEGLIEFEILDVLPFDSDRKRMSIILRQISTQQIVLYTKGADSNVLPIVETSNDYQSQEILYRTQQQLNVSSRRGLRVLVLAKKNLSEEEYQHWSAAHHEIEATMQGRERKLQRSYAAMESRLELLGCTGVEDRLQEGVPETLSALREAGIMVWVLTGDKQETAINIAYSCHLFSQDMEVIKINARSKDAAERTVNFYLEQVERERAEVASVGGGGGGGTWKRRPPTPASLWSTDTASTVERGGKKALVVDGKTLTYFLDSRSQLQMPFLRLAGHCSAVLCCRTTPLQKAYIVRIVKNQLGALTMAVGDGANDVSMIQTADVGIGISGQEGMQAVMASDFALARFRYLQRLLLVHGHWCYDRLARMVLYFLYKNATFVFVIFWYQLYCGFSGAVMIDQIYLSLFNLMFTSLPPFAVGIYDQDCPAELLMAQPHLYNQGRLSQVYKPHSFWVNMADALYQSIVIFFFAVHAYADTSVDIWEFGTTVTVMCLVTMLLHACIEIKSWTWIHAASIVLSLVCFFVFALVYNAVCLAFPSLSGSYWVMQMATTDSPTLYLAALLAGVTAVLPRLTLRSLQHTFWPSPVVRANLHRRRAEESHQMQVLSAAPPWSSSTSLSSVSVVRTSEYSGVAADRLEQNGMPSVA